MDKPIDTPSKRYMDNKASYDMIRDLQAGTKRLREQGRLYLPQYPNEADSQYKIRLHGAVLINYFSHTLSSLSGAPFSRKATIEPDTPEVNAFAADATLDGEDLHRFLHRWFKEAVAVGSAAAVVDVVEGKPFLSVYPADKVLDYKKGMYIKLMDSPSRIREISPEWWKVWEKVDGKWAVSDEGVNTYGKMPVSMFAFDADNIPLLDLAYLNIAHWESKADQVNALRVARFPILAVSGVVDTSNIVIAPNRWLSTPDSQGRWYYVESAGNAIDLGAKDLIELESKMSMYGAQFLRKKPTAETATTRILDSAESMSALDAGVINFQDAVDLLLAIAAEVSTLPDMTVTINHSNDAYAADGSDVDALIKLRANRDISRQSLLLEMKRRGVLNESFDDGIDLEWLQSEIVL